MTLQISGKGNAVDEQNPAPRKNFWDDDSPVDAYQQWFLTDKVVQDFVQPKNSLTDPNVFPKF